MRIVKQVCLFGLVAGDVIGAINDVADSVADSVANVANEALGNIDAFGQFNELTGAANDAIGNANNIVSDVIDNQFADLSDAAASVIEGANLDSIVSDTLNNAINEQLGNSELADQITEINNALDGLTASGGEQTKSIVLATVVLLFALV